MWFKIRTTCKLENINISDTVGRLKKQGSAVWEVLLVMVNVQVSVFALRQVIFTYLLEKGVFHSSASAVQPQSFLAVCGLIPAVTGFAPAQNQAPDPVEWFEKWFQWCLRNPQFENSSVERGHAHSSRGLESPDCCSGVQDSPSSTSRSWQRSPCAVVRGAILPQELSGLCSTGNASCHPGAGRMVEEKRKIAPVF